jgi:heat shock protein HtpX
MPFTHLDIKEQRTKKTVLLFILLFLFYFIGIFILTALIQFIFIASPFTEPGLLGWKLISLFFWSFIVAVSVALIHWLFSVSGGMNRIITALKAHPLDPDDRYHHRVQDIIDELKIATGTTGKNICGMVLPTVAVNAFAVGDFRGNSVIGVTEGLIARLNRQQLEAVLAHEMAHIVNRDAVIVTIACSLFAVYAQLLNAMEDAVFDGNSGNVGVLAVYARQNAAPLATIPILWLLTMGTYFLNILISRQREYLADATTIELTRDPLGLAEALYKVANSWRGIGYTDNTLSTIFIMPADDTELDNSEGWFADTFSTHPPLSKRLEVLLNLGKIDMATFTQQIGAEGSRIREKGEVTSPLPEVTWYVRTESNQWQGPYTALQLTSIPFITPDSWVTQNKSMALVHAALDPLLSDLFRLRLEGKMLLPYLCPKCRQSLTKIEYEGTQVSRCHFCGGTLIEEQNLFRIFAREEKQFSEQLKKKAEELLLQWRINPFHKGMKLSELVSTTFPAYRCPKCLTEMLRAPYTLQYFIVVDRCYSCNLIWLDKEELELLQIMIEKRVKK